MRRFFGYLPLLVPLLVAVPFASAQSSFDINLGFGAVQDKAGPGVDENTFLTCSSVTAAGACANTPSLNGFIMGFGGNLLLWKHLGFGADVSFQPAKQNYLVLQPAVTSLGQPAITEQSRMTFYDFDAIYQPVSSKKYSVQLRGGIGGANLRFYENQTGTNALTGNFNQSQYAGSSNHFQVNGGVGVQIYVSGNMFIRPQFDVHYVNNFFQFGRNLVTEETVWIGYSFGRQ